MLSFPSSHSLLLLFSFLSLASLTYGQATISSPASVTQCLPQQLTVSGGEPPYTIDVLPGGSTGGQPLETLPTLNEAGTVRWVPTEPAGQTVTLAVRDNTGAVNFSSEIPILAGSDTSCATASGSASGGASSAASTSGSASSDSTSGSASASSGSTSASGSSSRTSGTTTSNTRSTTTATTSASQTSATAEGSNGAGRLVVQGAQCLALPAVLVAVFAA
ncbi:hypothetical protein JCM10207_008342 [Rhodosporidiobolus poonsookiae]